MVGDDGGNSLQPFFVLTGRDLFPPADAEALDKTPCVRVKLASGAKMF